MAVAWKPDAQSPETIRWISLDLHVHSTYSGGSLSPGEILQTCRNLLLDGVAITDHNLVQGSLEGAQLAANNSQLPLALTSQEISAGDHFHILLIGSKEPQPDPRRSDLLDIIHNHRQMGGAVVLAHPWTFPLKRWAKDCLREMLTENLVDAVEMCNGTLAEFDGSIDRILKEIWEEWVCPYKLGVVGGSDYHYSHRGRVIGSGRTYLQLSGFEEADLIGAIRSRRSIGGIFHHRALDLGWLGSGHRFMIGLAPWLGELEQFITGVNAEIAAVESAQPLYGRYLRNLIEAGHFQMAHDWIRGMS